MSEIVDLFPDKTVHSGRAPRERTVKPRAVAGGLMENVDRLDLLLVVGLTHDNRLYAASSHLDVADILLAVDRFKRRLLAQFGNDEFVE